MGRWAQASRRGGVNDAATQQPPQGPDVSLFEFSVHYDGINNSSNVFLDSYSGTIPDGVTQLRVTTTWPGDGYTNDNYVTPIVFPIINQGQFGDGHLESSTLLEWEDILGNPVGPQTGPKLLPAP